MRDVSQTQSKDADRSERQSTPWHSVLVIPERVERIRKHRRKTAPPSELGLVKTQLNTERTGLGLWGAARSSETTDLGEDGLVRKGKKTRMLWCWKTQGSERTARSLWAPGSTASKVWEGPPHQRGAASLPLSGWLSPSLLRVVVSFSPAQKKTLNSK